MQRITRATSILLAMVIWPNVAHADDHTGALSSEVIRLQTRPGVTQEFLVMQPAGTASGTVIMFPPDDGQVSFKFADGRLEKIKHGGWIGQTTRRYLDKGYAIAIVRPPSDMMAFDPQNRKSPEHAEDMRHVIDHMNARFGIKPFLLGTCRSTHSVSSVDAKVDNASIAGVVLSSSRSRGKRGSILDDIAPKRISTRVLLVHHVDDDCGGSPYSGVTGLARAFEAAMVNVVSVKGGWNKPGVRQQKRGCGENGSHKFYGAQAETVDAIQRWMRGEVLAETLDVGN